MCETATVEIMCAARERRQMRQRTLLERFPGTLVCFSLNIAGSEKCPRFSYDAMEMGETALFAALAAVPLLHREEYSSLAGYERYYCFDAEPAFIKHAAVEVEDSHPLGRLFDLDVLDEQGAKLSREEFGLPQRKCLLCGAPAYACARSRSHTVEELQNETNARLSGYFREKAAAWLTDAVDAALEYEVSVTPKPGLVDRNNNGAHRDMTYAHFAKSVAALHPHWGGFVRTGWEHSGEPEDLLPLLRPLGLAAEQAMLSETHGVNTHKGAIFSLGLLLAAAGRVMAEDRDFSQNELLEIAARIASPALAELDNIHSPQTHGEKIYLITGALGARGEAAKGFPHAQMARERIESWMDSGLDENDAGVLALLSLIAEMEDTNIASRVGVEQAEELRKKAAALLDGSPREASKGAFDLDKIFIKLGASPGGCADMLAAGWLLHCIFCE